MKQLGVELEIAVLKLKNAAGTFVNAFANATTAARIWTFPDKNITIAGIDDITAGNFTGTLGKENGGTGVTASTIVAQVVSTETGTVATGTTTIPLDNTTPQNTEGNQYMSLGITPKNSNSTLKIEVNCFLSNNINTTITAALFQDSTANALSSGFITVSAFGLYQVVFTHIMSAGTTSATTFKVRAGSHAAGTTTFNGSNGSAVLNGTLSSSIVITEFLP